MHRVDLEKLADLVPKLRDTKWYICAPKMDVRIEILLEECEKGGQLYKVRYDVLRGIIMLGELTTLQLDAVLLELLTSCTGRKDNWVESFKKGIRRPRKEDQYDDDYNVFIDYSNMVVM